MEESSTKAKSNEIPASRVGIAPDRGDSSPSVAQEQTQFAITGIGASAGGLAALEQFLAGVPTSARAGIVVVTHTHAGQVSILPELLGKATQLPVEVVKDGGRVLPGRVYVPEPGCRLAVLDGALQIVPADGEPGLAVDSFFRSLANDQKHRAIGVILSGTGTDGTLGLKAIKEHSGLVMAQEPSTAQYDGMPRSAIATGLVDLVGSPTELATRMVSYAEGRYLGAPTIGLNEELSAALKDIFPLLRGHSGHDFSQYKSTTIVRRLERRMNIHRIDSAKHYVRFLRDNPHELHLLFTEFLIGVTNFFRDPEAFESLAEHGLIPLVDSKEAGDPLRVWVPGCSTGEEAYSIAILLDDALQARPKRLEAQIFATDLDADAIERARSGRFPESAGVDIPRQHLPRYFVPQDGELRVGKEIRDMIVFAVQDLIADPPFTKLDLISCRNLLIYLEPVLQNRIIEMFHYSLSPEGLLFLGSSESIGRCAELFSPVDKKWKLFRRLPAQTAKGLEIPLLAGARTKRLAAEAGGPRPADNLVKVLERELSRLLIPPSVVVNDRGDIVHVHGRTGLFLEPSPGRPSHNVLAMARDGLRTVLAAAIRRLGRDSAASFRAVEVRTNGSTELVTVRATRLIEPELVRGLSVLSFEVIQRADVEPSPSDVDSPPAAKLEEELQYTKDSLQSTIEELETSNEELKSTNEELQSTNEELQSANEELETSREELQSLNEELQTVNTELQSKIDELSQLNDDMRNLLNSTEIATIFLDEDLRIKRFTSHAKKVVRMIESDVGRPLSDLASQLDYRNLVEDARGVLENLEAKQAEIRSKDGTWYLTRILPYRTTENVIDGLVLTFVEITQIKNALEAAEDSTALSRNLFRSARSPLVLVDEAERIVSANPRFCELVGAGEEQLSGRSLLEIGRGAWDQAAVRDLLSETRKSQPGVHETVIESEFPTAGRRRLLIEAHLIDHGPRPAYVVLAMEDTTDRGPA